MARRTIVSEEEETEINLSPMIDCVFILLIFFIVTTVFVDEKGIQVNKPDAAAPSTPEETENIVFEISADDKIHFEGKEIGLADVTGRVKAHLGDGETPVVIRTSAKARNGVFVRVWDAARQGGAQAMSFSTVE